MYKVLIRENVFTCVTFGAIFIFAIVQTCNPPSNLTALACILAILILILSVFKLIITILEDVIEKQNRENEWSQDVFDNSWEAFEAVLECDKKDLEEVIKKALKGNKDDLGAETLREYRFRWDLKWDLRKIRRGFLYAYYIVFMVMLIALLLRDNVVTLVQENIQVIMDTGVITLWSLIIILLEIMMKEIIENIVFGRIENHIEKFREE